MKTIPPSLHAYADYGSVILFGIAPWIFWFSDVPVAKWISLWIAALILLMSLMTRYEGGLIRVIPLRVHLIMDAIVGIFLILSPWWFGFYEQTYLFHVLMGMVVLGSALFTQAKVKTENLTRLS